MRRCPIPSFLQRGLLSIPFLSFHFLDQHAPKGPQFRVIKGSIFQNFFWQKFYCLQLSEIAWKKTLSTHLHQQEKKHRQVASQRRNASDAVTLRIISQIYDRQDAICSSVIFRTIPPYKLHFRRILSEPHFSEYRP